MTLLIAILNACLPEALPPLSDLERFPPREQVRCILAWQESHLKWLDRQRELDPAHAAWWRAWRCDAQRSYLAWETLSEALYHYDDETWRREKLGRLRTLLGAERYYAGQMPCIAPLEWFTLTD